MLCTAFFGFLLEQFDVAHVLNHLFWFWTKWVICLILSQILLKSVSISVVLNFLNERWYFAHAAQQNVVALEFWSPCPPRSALFAHDSNCHDQWIFHEMLSPTLDVSRSWKERVWELRGHFLCLFQKRVSSFSHVPFHRLHPYCLRMNVLGLNLVSTTGLPVLKTQVLLGKN